MATDAAKEIRNELRRVTALVVTRVEKELEAAGGGVVAELREQAKNDAGRLTEFGKGFIALSKANNLKQSFVARILDISPGAVSQHYNKE